MARRIGLHICGEVDEGVTKSLGNAITVELLASRLILRNFGRESASMVGDGVGDGDGQEK
jgi:hypothetical protein